MLPLVSGHHVYGLLQQVEVEILIRKRRREVEVAVDEDLRPCVEKRIDVRLVPTGLFQRLEFRIEIIQPLTDVSLIWF